LLIFYKEKFSCAIVKKPVMPWGMENNILTAGARAFLEALHREFQVRRLDLLNNRKVIQKQLDEGWRPVFPEETQGIREDPHWSCVKAPQDLQKRHVEITGPVERKMMINALNSGADVFLADFEDALSPTWKNVIDGQENLIDAVQKRLEFTSPEGKIYRLQEKLAALIVRPRAWHLEESHFEVDKEAISASLFDFGLYLFHNGKALLEQGSGPYFYLPKIENRFEAKLWNDVFVFSEKYLKLPHQSIKATVLIETILAAFEMEEILFKLKDYVVGLNAGRWDYIFSIIKKFSTSRHFCFPDRKQITMTVPFMKAYTSKLVSVCKKRGAHAMGGMSAFVPNRKNPKINEEAFEQVRQDKLREVSEGFEGTWVAHPDLVRIAREVFETAPRDEVKEQHVTPEDLLNFQIAGGEVTAEGVLLNISVALQYLDSWLKGVGSLAINNLMEDAATAEISRAQVWQWVHHQKFPKEQVMEWMQEEKDRLKVEAPYVILKKLVGHKEFIDFLTSEAYPYL
jgi:malate synthase